MIPPFAAPQDFKSSVHPPAGGEAYWFIFSGSHLLVGDDGKSLPTHHNFALQRTLYMGTWKGKHLFAADVDAATQPPWGWFWSSLRPLHVTLSEEHYALAGRAMQLLHWDRTHQYCGCCGAATSSRPDERCRECRSCGQLAYPKQSVAILALVRRGEQILLARGPHFPEAFYSALAGFVDPGETLEQCVAREVLEEVGIKVKNIRYFGSQPWPFSNSLMIGFFCEWAEGEIQIDPSEIESAAWFDLSHLPQLPPPVSLARLLIDQAVKETQKNML